MTALEGSFEKALKRLREALAEEPNDLMRDAAIQRFEFTVELAWKAIQQKLRTEGIICRSPKECLKEAFAFGLVQDDQAWIRMMDDRNLTTHTYNEKTAKEIFSHLPEYLPSFDALAHAFKG